MKIRRVSIQGFIHSGATSEIKRIKKCTIGMHREMLGISSINYWV